MLDSGLAHLRTFARTLRRQPLLSSTVIGVLAVGIAATAAVYAVVEALVLDPFPYPEPESLVLIGSEQPAIGRELGYFERLSGPEIEDIRKLNHSLQHLLAFDLNSVRVQGTDFPQRLFALYAWQDPLVTLGLQAQLGRSFRAAELQPDSQVLMISHRLWQSRYGGDPEVLGRTLVVDGQPHTVIGVAPPACLIFSADLWLPPGERLTAMDRERRHLNLLARADPDKAFETVGADLAAVAARIEREHPGTQGAYDGWRLSAVTWNRYNAFGFANEAVLALGSIVFVLILISANLANLLLSRATTLRGESAVRLALGATHAQIVRRSLVESLLFALCGGALALALISPLLQVLSAWLPGAMQPQGNPIVLDRATVLFAAAATALSAAICGLLPALHLKRTNLQEALHSQSRSSAGRPARRLQRLLVVSQVSTAVVLLAGAASLVTAWQKLVRQDMGFATERLLSMRISLPRNAYDGVAVSSFFERLQEEVRALPGVEEASIATQVAPNTYFGAELRLPGLEPATEAPRPMHTVVGDNYAKAMGLQIRRGRFLDEDDHQQGPCAVVLNELAAERYLPGRQATGQHVRLLGSRFDSGDCEVVGVVATVRNRGPLQEAAPEVFSSHRQAGGRYNQMYLVVRTHLQPASLVSPIRTIVQRLDPEQPVYAVGTAEAALASQLAPRRVVSQLLACFAATALLLAAFAIYGVVSHGVTQRRQELSLRTALGARQLDLVTLVLRESVGAVGLGLMLGILGALAVAAALRQQLQAAGELAPWLLLLPVILLTLIAACAAALPVLRRGHASPAQVLRDL